MFIYHLEQFVGTVCVLFECGADYEFAARDGPFII